MAITVISQVRRPPGPWRVRTLRAWQNITPATDDRGRVTGPPSRSVVGVGAVVELEDTLLALELIDSGKAERVPIETPLRGPTPVATAAPLPGQLSTGDVANLAAIFSRAAQLVAAEAPGRNRA